jgi:hypothetical protein
LHKELYYLHSSHNNNNNNNNNDNNNNQIWEDEMGGVCGMQGEDGGMEPLGRPSLEWKDDVLRWIFNKQSVSV